VTTLELDSNTSRIDVPPWETEARSPEISMLHLHRCCPERNMARFYAMDLERSLFGHFVLVRRWGRIGSRGRLKSDWFDDPDTARMSLDRLLERKLRRGYSRVEGETA
jgi:predicted DNA-binding WGR domain protein